MNDINLSEKDIELIFGGKKPKNKSGLRQLWLYPSVFVLIFILSYFVINFPALSNVLNYWYKSEISTNTATPQSFPEAIISIKSNTEPESLSSKIPSISDNHIFIPKISVDAPVSWQVVNNESNIQSNLQKGVVHLAGSSLPGTKGNVFITGHSSNYFWAKGNYKNIFSLLNQLVVGDLVYIKYQNILYIYKTSDLKTVAPSDTSVLNQTDDSILTLMTCTPVGTSLKRLIVKAEQIYPEKSANTLGKTTNSNQSLPSGVR